MNSNALLKWNIKGKKAYCDERADDDDEVESESAVEVKNEEKDEDNDNKKADKESRDNEIEEDIPGISILLSNFYVTCMKSGIYFL